LSPAVASAGLLQAPPVNGMCPVVGGREGGQGRWDRGSGRLLGEVAGAPV